MDYPNSKEKLPKGLSYPLGRSVLEAALAKAGIEAVDDLDMMVQRRKTPLTSVMSVEYDGEETARPWKGPGAITIRMYAVPSSIKHAVATALKAGELAELVRWVAAIPARAETWRMINHRYELDVDVDSPERLHVTQT